MEILLLIPLSLFALALLISIYKIYKVISWIFLSFVIYQIGRNPFKHVDFFPAKLPPQNKVILNKYFLYYKNLPEKLKPVFESRLSKFMDLKDFDARKGLVLTEEMKTLLSACAVQLSFGLKNYKFKHFWKIIIYPEKYFSNITKQYHLGEANPKGAIVFSWPDFLQGYADPDDNINLGLHEFAHALFINFQKNIMSDVNFATYYDEWKAIGTEEFFKLRKNKENYMRNYAKVNLMEFFAVSIEYFFETPNEFKKHYPDLYEILRKLLGQDTCKWVKT